jgi:small-conductance mechanosensitive channel/CRP-like cAMP-binding protein
MFDTTLLGVHLLQAIGLGLGVALLLWLLRAFPFVQRVWVSLLLTVVVAGLYFIAGDLTTPNRDAIIRTITAAGVLLGAYTLLQLFDVLMWDYIVGRRRHVSVPRFAVDVFNFVALIAVALIVLRTVFEVDLNPLLVTSTVLSAVIGLSLQDLLVNVIAGFALQLERPFGVGDWVGVGEREGQIVQMNWRSMTLRTLDNQHVIVPNANAARQEVVNFTRPSALQALHAMVGVAYQHPPGAVKAVLLRAATSTPGVQSDPAPEVWVTGYGDFAINYDIRYWITDYAHRPQIHDTVMTHIWYELRRAGMTIPFPIRDVNVHTLPPDHATRTQEQLQNDLTTSLRRLAVLAPLSDPAIAHLARNVTLHRYATGETLVRQGDTGDSLFVIHAGRVRIERRLDNGQLQLIRRLGPDEFFGEMSLLTGEPRSASAIAEEETVVVVVEKPAFAEVLETDPEILDALSLQLEARLRDQAEQLSVQATAPAAGGGQRGRLVEQIKRFFGI